MFTMRFMVQFTLLFSLAAAVHGKTIELNFPELQHRIKVVLPDDYDPSKKYPALLYYHGQGGKPDTSLMLHHAGSKQWIIVGMTYYQLGAMTMSREAMAKEMTLLRSVKRHLQTKYGMDPARCYVGGFSKGGWMTDMFLQADPSLAGGVILGAGHLHEYHKSPVRYQKKKPVFIGVGRLDPNYPYALKAVLHHRKVGAHTNLEVWPDIAHSMPVDGSEGLQQWLNLRLLEKPALNETATNAMQKSYEEALKLAPLEQWQRLGVIRDQPYADVLGSDWKKPITQKMEDLEKVEPVKSEAQALAKHRKILYQEITKVTLTSLVQVHNNYQALADQFPSTVEGKLASKDRDRTAAMIKQVQEQKDTPKEEKKEPFAPKDPERKRRIPMNPLAR